MTPPWFSLYPLRFQFSAVDRLFFPEGKASNIVRGAFGNIFRHLVCKPGCRDAYTCERRQTCPYARIFEPSMIVTGPSGMANPPRPFVFRASHLDGRWLGPGEEFFFDVNLFDTGQPSIAFFVASFAQLASEGLGPGRGRASLEKVTRVRPLPEQHVFDGKSRRFFDPIEPWRMDLTPGNARVDRIKVEFKTPTELKAGNQITTRPEFISLFARVRDRLSALRNLYGAGPLEIDFRAMGKRAEAVRLKRYEMRHVSIRRRSGRSGQVHPMGGFVGTAEYEGDLAEFIPFLKAAEWTGVGRQTVWGKGSIRVSVLGTSPS